MPNFDNGVSSYIKGKCTIEVNFPVDNRGHTDVRCDMCRYYGRSSKTCQLNKEIVYYPERYIGANCPLKFDEEVDEDD